MYSMYVSKALVRPALAAYLGEIDGQGQFGAGRKLGSKAATNTPYSFYSFIR